MIIFEVKNQTFITYSQISLVVFAKLNVATKTICAAFGSWTTFNRAND